MGDNCSTLGRREACDHGRSLWGLRPENARAGRGLAPGHGAKQVPTTLEIWGRSPCLSTPAAAARLQVWTERAVGKAGVGESGTWGSLPSPNPSPWQQAKGRRAVWQS